MLLAIFNEGNKKQARVTPQLYFQTVGDRIVPFLPVYFAADLNKKKNRKLLQTHLHVIKKADADIWAMPSVFHPYLPPNRVYFADGNQYRLSLLPQLLNAYYPGWQKAFISVPLTDDFMTHTARILATEIKWLNLCRSEKNTLQKTADIIYQESGLIAQISKDCPNDAELIICPPDRSIPAASQTAAFHSWPRYITDPQNNLLNSP